jgi:hypothetical protein
MDCKLVGTVKATKIWAGDCAGASELRGATPAEEVPSPPPQWILYAQPLVLPLQTGDLRRDESND